MEDRRMLLSIWYQMVRWLLGLTVVLVRRDLSKDAELLVLRHEKAVLRREITRVHYTPADRMWLTCTVRCQNSVQSPDQVFLIGSEEKTHRTTRVRVAAMRRPAAVVEPGWCSRSLRVGG
jgi:hypothetical protein